MQPGRSEKERGDGKAGGHTTTPSEGEGVVGDGPGYTPTPEDLHLWDVYGDWVHTNPGTHLEGGIRKDSAWQAWWHDLAVALRRAEWESWLEVCRDARGGAQEGAGQTVELRAVHRLQTVILQRAWHVTAYQDILLRIEKILDAWAEGSHRMLVEVTL